MKSYNHLWEKFISSENYYLGIGNATKHKGGKKSKYRLAQYFRNHADELKDDMLAYAANFKNAEHTPKFIYDGIRRKKRQIYVPTMKEQVIHHMIVNILQPIFMHGMYEHSYGSIPNRGGHLAKKRLERWIRNDSRNFKYILKLDIQKYFDSIPHGILKAKLARLIHDDRFLSLMNEIVDVMPGDRGIPIGFYTSQWIANWYLQDLDHYIKEELRARYYVRYMDDMVIAGSNKRELHQMREAIEVFLDNELGLRLKDNWQVFRFDYKGKYRDLDFMGFRFFRDRTILRKPIMLKASRKARRINKKGKNIYTVRQMLSYLGWINATDTYDWFKDYIKPFVSFRSLRLYISRWDKMNKLEVSMI